MENVSNDKNIKFWINGKTEKSLFTLKINKKINTLKKLKEHINYEKNSTKSIEKIKIYNEKGMEIDDADVENLINDELLYISFDNSKFNILNYVNQYEIIKPIKSGGYGEVLLGKNVLTNKIISIKRINIKGFSTNDLYNFSRETLYLSNLKHKNIIKMYCSYQYKDYLYNIMDYAEGGELSQLINSDIEIPEFKIKDIFKQIIEGVKFIHGKNVIHRDLKPNNILFLDKEKTHIVIIDFGISGISNGLNKEIIKAGTFKFTPPEILSKNNFQSSNKIDIWSLGVILYLMYFKKYPFDGENNKEIRKKVERDELKFPIGIKIRKSLVNLLRGMFEKNAKRRIDCNDYLFDLYFNDDSEEFEIFKNEVNKKKFRIIPDLDINDCSNVKSEKSKSNKNSNLGSFRKKNP
jgi:calcium-dependent protein kinase